MTSETDATREIDTLYPKACLIVQNTGNTGIAHLQRVLRTGYNQTARLLEAMEEDGIVSSCDASGKRRLLVTNNPTVLETVMDKNTWITRCAARYVERAEMDECKAQAHAEALYEVRDDDEGPEESADEDMLYWSD